MHRQSLTLVTAPTRFPVTLGELKAWARIDTDDQDQQLTQLIAAASAAAEQYLRRSLTEQTWKVTLDLAPSCLDSILGDGVYDLPVTALYGGLPRTIDLPKGPVQSITSVKTTALDNTQSTFDPSSYYLDSTGSRLVLNYGAMWPVNLRPEASVEITYVTGYTAVPNPIKTGIMIHAAALYEQRGQCGDDAPPGAKQLYAPYRVIGGSRG